MKTIKYFLITGLFFLLSKNEIFAAQTGQNSFISSLPIAPLLILFLLLIVSGIIVYRQLKKDKKNPYNLPSSPTPQTSPAVTEIQTVNPPVQSYSPDNLSTTPISNPIPTPALNNQTKSPRSKSLIFGLAVILLIGVGASAFYVIKLKTKKLSLYPIFGTCPIGDQGQTGENCENLNRCDKAGGCNPACCLETSDCPSGQTCSVENGFCRSGKSCNPSTSQHKECKFDASQGKNICANVPGTGNDQCTSNEQCLSQPTPTTTPPAGGQVSCTTSGSTVTITNNTNSTIDVTCVGYDCNNITAQNSCTNDNCQTGWHQVTGASLSPGQSKSCTAGSGQICSNRQVDWVYNGQTSVISNCYAFNRNCPNPYICQGVPTTTPQPPTTTPRPPTTTPPPPTVTPNIPQISCSGLTINGSNDKVVNVNLNQALTLAAQVSNFGYLSVAKVTDSNTNVVDGTNIQRLTSGNNTLNTTFIPTENGFYVFEVNAYESQSCQYLCSAGSVLYRNNVGLNRCVTNSTDWRNIGSCQSTNCRKWIQIGQITPAVPVCRGLRLLAKQDNVWTDLTDQERNNIASGTIVRLVLPKIVGGNTADKAEFHVYIDGTAELQKDATETMIIEGITYYYVELTTRFAQAPLSTYSTYTIDGWLSFGGSWY